MEALVLLLQISYYSSFRSCSSTNYFSMLPRPPSRIPLLGSLLPRTPQPELITPTPSFSHHSILFLDQMERLSRCITVNRTHLSPYRLWAGGRARFIHLLSPRHLKAYSRCSINACWWLNWSGTGFLEAQYRSELITMSRAFPTVICKAKKRRDQVDKQRQGPRSHPRLTWDPAMSRAAAISGSGLRLPGERAGKAASRQHYRRRKAGREAQKTGPAHSPGLEFWPPGG